MKRVKDEKGFKRYVFSPGDGMLKRWAEHLQKWRAVAPARRKLAHAAAWYLDADARARRPLYGLHALAIFTERILWEALTRYDPDGREVASSRRAFLAVRKKMAQMRYRGGKNGRVTSVPEKSYLRSSVTRCVALAGKAFRLVQGVETEGFDDRKAK